MEGNNEFKEADKKFDKMEEKAKGEIKDLKSNIQLKKKIFMKISDVDVDDAAWLKKFCDKHADGKQFLGIKVIRNILEFAEPLLGNITSRIEAIESRVETLEMANEVPEEKPKVELPATQRPRQ